MNREELEHAERRLKHVSEEVRRKEASGQYAYTDKYEKERLELQVKREREEQRRREAYGR